MAKVPINWGPAPEDCSIKLFVVYNTAHNSQFVLARDRARAMSIAHSANHVYSPQEKHAETYSRVAYEVTSPDYDLSQHWQAIQAAIERRVEGTLHIEAEQVSVGYEVFEG
jgi:hypothetical protein